MSLGIDLHQIAAILAVNGYTAASGNHPENLLTWHWRAAFRQVMHETTQAADAAGFRLLRGKAGESLLRPLLLLLLLADPVDDLSNRDVAVTNRCQNVLRLGQVELLANLFELFRTHELRSEEHTSE